MTVIEGIGNCFNNLNDLILILTLVMILGLTEFTTLHVLHDDIEVVIVVVDLVDFYNIGVFEPQENLTLVKECPDVLLTNTFLVDDFDGILVKVLAKDGFLDFGEGSLAERLLKDVVVLDGFGRDEVRDHYSLAGW